MRRPLQYQTVLIVTNGEGDPGAQFARIQAPRAAARAAAAALVLTTTTALAGSGVGGVFNLGQVNTVDAQTILTGNPGGNP